MVFIPLHFLMLVTEANGSKVKVEVWKIPS